MPHFSGELLDSRYTSSSNNLLDAWIRLPVSPVIANELLYVTSVLLIYMINEHGNCNIVHGVEQLKRAV